MITKEDIKHLEFKFEVKTNKSMDYIIYFDKNPYDKTYKNHIVHVNHEKNECNFKSLHNKPFFVKRVWKNHKINGKPKKEKVFYDVLFFKIDEITEVNGFNELEEKLLLIGYEYDNLVDKKSVMDIVKIFIDDKNIQVLFLQQLNRLDSYGYDEL